MGFPEGSSSRICLPPMPATISLRKWAPASRRASTVAARSLTEDSAPQAAPSSAAAV